MKLFKNVKANLKNKKGFTLIEIIVVLVILAILAAAAIPSMMGFIEDSRGKALIAEARAAYVACQAIATEEVSAGTRIVDIAAAFDTATTVPPADAPANRNNQANLRGSIAFRLQSMLLPDNVLVADPAGVINTTPDRTNTRVPTRSSASRIVVAATDFTDAGQLTRIQFIKQLNPTRIATITLQPPATATIVFTPNP